MVSVKKQASTTRRIRVENAVSHTVMDALVTLRHKSTAPPHTRTRLAGILDSFGHLGWADIFILQYVLPFCALPI